MQLLQQLFSCKSSNFNNCSIKVCSCKGGSKFNAFSRNVSSGLTLCAHTLDQDESDDGEDEEEDGDDDDDEEEEACPPGCDQNLYEKVCLHVCANLLVFSYSWS